MGSLRACCYSVAMPCPGKDAVKRITSVHMCAWEGRNKLKAAIRARTITFVIVTFSIEILTIGCFIRFSWFGAVLSRFRALVFPLLLRCLCHPTLFALHTNMHIDTQPCGPMKNLHTSVFKF